MSEYKVPLFSDPHVYLTQRSCYTICQVPNTRTASVWEQILISLSVDYVKHINTRHFLLWSMLGKLRGMLARLLTLMRLRQWLKVGLKSSFRITVYA